MDTKMLDPDKRPKPIRAIKPQVLVALMGLATVLFLLMLIIIAYRSEHYLNSFVLSVLAGCGGGSISIVHRLITRKVELDEIADSWFSILLPLAYAGGMAMIAYLLFMGGILTGKHGTGLFTFNWFPIFDIPPLNGEPLNMQHVFAVHPQGTFDFAILLGWCFVVGIRCSERFITGLLTTPEGLM